MGSLVNSNLEIGPIAPHLNSLHVQATMDSRHDLYTKVHQSVFKLIKG